MLVYDIGMPSQSLVIIISSFRFWARRKWSSSVIIFYYYVFGTTFFELVFLLSIMQVENDIYWSCKTQCINQVMFFIKCQIIFTSLCTFFITEVLQIQDFHFNIRKSLLSLLEKIKEIKWIEKGTAVLASVYHHIYKF